MSQNRRSWVRVGAGAALSGLCARTGVFEAAGFGNETLWRERSFVGPTHALVPVVGDGKWIENDPPAEESGFYEPRSFELNIEIQLRGRGNARQISAFTAVPVSFPEQRIDEFRLEKHGCQAGIQQLTPHAARLFVRADSIRAGQVLSATAKYRLTISKSYFGYGPEMFPEVQQLPSSARAYLGDGPGIKASSRQVRKLATEIQGDSYHPWEMAKAFREWVWENIKGRHQDYTNVDTALRKRVGDCEERAAVFVALCRASNIPARLVWVPNHNWAEIMLVDEAGNEHWIPSHTSAYSWFGWTGAHELVLQKGDKVPIPGKPPARLIYDNLRSIGKQPEVRFIADLKPVSELKSDPGPGARHKQEDGKWKLVPNHEAQKYMRE